MPFCKDLNAERRFNILEMFLNVPVKNIFIHIFRPEQNNGVMQNTFLFLENTIGILVQRRFFIGFITL